MRRRISRKKRAHPTHIRAAWKEQFELYRTVLVGCTALLKTILKPCLCLARRRELNKKSLAVVLISSWRQSLSLRLAAVREHLRTIHVAYEQTLYWLHSANPYSF